MDKKQKLRNAIVDPAYRLELLTKGDPDLSDVVFNALACVEFVFRAAAAGCDMKDLSIKKAYALGDPSTWKYSG
jgi:hypothetical protein